MCKICRNESLEELTILDCSNYTELTSIPNIPGLNGLICDNCPQLTSIPNIQGLKELYCRNCPQLISIGNIQGLMCLDCYESHELRSAPLVSEEGWYPEQLIRMGKMWVHEDEYYRYHKIANNIFSLWKYFKLMRYVGHLNQFVYSDPRQPYMQYFIKNQLYDNNNESFKIGYITGDGKLVWLKLDAK